MWLKFRVSIPISSRLVTASAWANSPAATCRVPAVRARMGVIRICESRKASTTQITRPSTSDWRMMEKSWLVRALTVSLLSST